MDPRARGYLLVVVSAVSFGGVAVVGKLLLDAGESVPTVLFWRWLLGAVALAPVALLLERPARDGRGPARRALAAAFLLGFVGIGGTSGLYFLALPHVLAAVASFLLFLNPLLVALLAAALLREHLGVRGWVALVTATAGLAVLTLAPGARAAPVGVALALGAAFVYACSIVAGRRLVSAGTPLTLAVVLMLGASAAFALAGSVAGSLGLPADARAWGLVVVLAVVCSAVSIGTFYAALPLIGAPRTALVSTLEPVSTVFLAAFVLGEWLRPLQLAGAALIALAVVGLVAERRAPLPPAGSP